MAKKAAPKKVEKPMTKSAIVAKVAEIAGLNKKQATAALNALTEVAYAGAKAGFTVPGLGKLVVVERGERKGRNPQTGKEIVIKAKKVLKFRVAKAAKDAILGKK